MYKYIAHEVIGGFYCRDTKMLVDRPLTGHEYAQAGVIFAPDGSIQLWSYAMLVCTIKGDFVYCCYHGTQTARKHIGWFMREYANSTYQVAKMSCDSGEWLNFKTGEVMTL